MTVDELQVLVTANTESLRKEINNVSKNFTKMQTSANKTSNSMLKSFNSLKRGIIALGIGKLIASQMDDAVSRVDTLNNFPKVMSNLGIGGEEAQASLSRLSDALIGLPTTLDDASMSVQRFTSANGNVKASTEMFLALNNAILAGGASTEIQKTALEQLSQSYAKGKPDMMEWRSAMTSMPAQLKQVAIAMGYSSANQLGENLRSGVVSMDEFMAKLVELNKNGVNGFQSFEEQARNSTGGIGTSITNVKTALTRGLAEIMNAIGQSNIAGFFQGIAKAINTVIPYITGFVKACLWAINSITSLFGGSSTTKQINQTSTALSNLGSSGTSTASDLDGATGSAKKLKKELTGLASFDEMTVLKETDNSDSGSSGGSSSGGTGVGDLSAFDTALSTTGNKADEIAERIQKSFEKVGIALSKIWNSEPIQAYSNLINTEFTFIKDLAVQLGTDLWTNITTTWSNVEGNVTTIFSNISTLFTQMWTDMALGIETWGQPIIDGVSNLFNSIWIDAIDPYLQIITKTWADFTGILVEKWNEHGKPLVDNIGEFVNKTIELFQKIWDDVLDPIITPFLESLSWLWDEHISKLIENVTDFVGKLINGALEIYNKFIQPILLWLIDKLAPAWAFLSNAIIGVLGSIFAVISDVIGSIIGIFGGIIDFIVGIFTGNWEKAWQGIVSIFQNLIDGIVGIFKFPINLIIDGINSFISGLNKIKIPDWVPVVGGKGINIPKIPKLARGGVVDRPMTAVIGEAGKEAVMPLENNTGWIDNLAYKLSAIMNNTSNGDNPVQLIIKLGEDTIFDKFIDYSRSKSFETNGEVFSL